jgi:hypothetical protein
VSANAIAAVADQLRKVIEGADRAAVHAMRAKTDAEQGRVTFAEAGRGTDHPDIREAISTVHTASQKLGKTARLLAEAAEAFAMYLEVVVPGSGNALRAKADAMPSGEQLVDEAREQENRLHSWLRKTGENADDIGDRAQSTSESAKTIFKLVRGDANPPTQSTTSVPSATPHIENPPAESSIDAVSAIVVSAIAVSVAVKAIPNYWRKIRKGRTSRDDTE